MLTAKFDKATVITLPGLTQWDYGQEITVDAPGYDIPESTEVHFYQGGLSSLGYIVEDVVDVPDEMLQRDGDIMMFIYVTDEDSGETVLKARMPVSGRPKPATYILPEYDGYTKLVPAGGAKGTVLTKRSSKDYDTYWDAPNVDAQSDWDETDIWEASYIKNKPGLASEEEDGFMSKEDYAKLAAFDYNELSNKPTLDGVTIEGDMYETDPTVPDWAKEEEKPTYSADEVGALDAEAALSVADLSSLWDSI